MCNALEGRGSVELSPGGVQSSRDSSRALRREQGAGTTVRLAVLDQDLRVLNAQPMVKLMTVQDRANQMCAATEWAFCGDSRASAGRIRTRVRNLPPHIAALQEGLGTSPL